MSGSGASNAETAGLTVPRRPLVQRYQPEAIYLKRPLTNAPVLNRSIAKVLYRRPIGGFGVVIGIGDGFFTQRVHPANEHDLSWMIAHVVTLNEVGYRGWPRTVVERTSKQCDLRT